MHLQHGICHAVDVSRISKLRMRALEGQEPGKALPARPFSLNLGITVDHELFVPSVGRT
jgi:hypothetical protein